MLLDNNRCLTTVKIDQSVDNPKIYLMVYYLTNPVCSNLLLKITDVNRYT